MRPLNFDKQKLLIWSSCIARSPTFLVPGLLAPHAGRIPAHSAALLHCPCARFQLFHQLYLSRNHSDERGTPMQFIQQYGTYMGLAHRAQPNFPLCVRLTQAEYQYICGSPCARFQLLHQLYLSQSFKRTGYAHLCSTEISYLFVARILRAAQL